MPKDDPRTPLPVRLMLAALGALLLHGASGGLAAAVFPSAVLPGDLRRVDPAVADAIRHQTRELNDRPGDLEAVETLCIIYEANILWDLARRCFGALAREAPDNLTWAYHHAVATRETGRTDESTEMMVQLAQKYPQFAPLQQRLGEALLQTGDLPGAETAYRRVIQLEPRSGLGYAGLGNALLRAGRTAAAIEALERAVERDPSYREARYLMGMAYRSAGRPEDAAREMALGLDASTRYLPDPLSATIEEYRISSTARMARGAALLSAGRPDQAAAVLEQALVYEPDNVTLLNNLGIAYLRQNQLEKAHQTLQRALQVDDRKFSTYLNLSSWALRSRQPEHALAYADAAIERAGNMYQTHLARARALILLGRREEALRSLETAVRLNTRSPEPFAMLADQLTRLGRYEQAETNYRDALSVAPDFFPALLGMASIYMEQGRLDDAARAIQQAGELAPGHPSVAAAAKQLEERQ